MMSACDRAAHSRPAQCAVCGLSRHRACVAHRATGCIGGVLRCWSHLLPEAVEALAAARWLTRATCLRSCTCCAHRASTAAEMAPLLLVTSARSRSTSRRAASPCSRAAICALSAADLRVQNRSQSGAACSVGMCRAGTKYCAFLEQITILTIAM